jgi:acyl-CoA synthetase (AMP-forming)/AMP-acid ligase II
METLANLLAKPAPVAGRAALLFEDNVYTYAELEALSNQVAQALSAQGVRPGNVVCQVLRSRPELIVNMFGILKSGAIYAPLNPSLTERELAEQLTDCRPSIIIAAPAMNGTTGREGFCSSSQSNREIKYIPVQRHSKKTPAQR